MIGILLAAGFSRRFGLADKLCQPLADGQWLAVHAATRLMAVLPQSVAVLRDAHHPLAARFTALGLQVTYCPADATDMADSLAQGVRYAQSMAGVEAGVVVALADMPLIQTQTIQQVSDAIAAGALIARPRYAGQAGHPVGFAPALTASLLQIKGDQGARSLIEQHAAQLTWLATEDAGCVYDIDVPADVHNLANDQP